MREAALLNAISPLRICVILLGELVECGLRTLDLTVDHMATSFGNNEGSRAESVAQRGAFA